MYTADSSLIGYRPIATAWIAALANHAATNRPAILAAYDQWCKAYNLDPNLAIGQACHEATYFTSARWTQENNPAGLGVVADNTPPNPFKTPQEGIQAHCEHLCCYVYDRASCPVDHTAMADRRHVFHDGMPALKDLIRPPARSWAFPGTGYVASIVAIANQYSGGDAPMPTQDFPTEADLGFPVRLEPTDFAGADRALGDIKWFVVHDTEGHYEGDIGVLTHGSRSGSVHFIIGRERGQFVASVPIRATAWTAGNDTLGALAVQVELSKAPDESGYTDWQYTAMAAAFRWCVAEGMTGVGTQYYWPHPPNADGGPLPDVPGIIGHFGVPNPYVPGKWGGFAGHTDPGPDFDWQRFVAAIGAPVAPPVVPNPVPDTRVNGHVLGGGFRAHWDANPARLQHYGLPVTEEYSGYLVVDAPAPLNKRAVPVTVQEFERCVFLYDPATPAPFDVRSPLRSEHVGPPDDVLIVAILHAMELAK